MMKYQMLKINGAVKRGQVFGAEQSMWRGAGVTKSSKSRKYHHALKYKMRNVTRNVISMVNNNVCGMTK
jgi:hypothetical protein